MDDDNDEKDDSKRKSRNLSEKKRRDQFNILINELCSMVSSSTRKMDKSSVLKSTISFLRSHSEISIQSQSSEVQENWKPSFLSNEEFTHLMLEALDGFIIVFSCNGRILYTSESIFSLLGYIPGNLNVSIFDIIHESDKQSLHKLLNTSNFTDSNHIQSKDSLLSLMVYIKHGPMHSQNSPTYELVRLVGNFHHWKNVSADGPNIHNFEYDNSSSCSHVSSNAEWQLCFVAMARLQTPKLLREMSLLDESKNEFTSRHSLEWKFLFLDHRAPPIIGYLPFEVLGTSGYDYYHIDDLEKVAACHEALMQTGEGTSCCYRFLTKGQQWIWLQTRYYITYHQWNSKPEFIVCTHTVVGYKQVQTTIYKENPLHKSDNLVKLEQLQGSAAATPVSCSSSNQSLALSASSRDSISSNQSEMSSVTTSGVQSYDPMSYEMRTNIQHLPPRSKNQTDYFSPSNTKTVPNCRSVMINDSNVANMSQTTIAPTTSQSSTMTISTLQPVIGLIGPPLCTNNTTPAIQPSNSHVERYQSTFSMASDQSQLQDYLRRRHQLLQQQILMQQEELRRVSEQLMLVQFVTPNLVSSPSYQYPTSSINMVSTPPNPCVQIQQVMNPLIHCRESGCENLPSQSAKSLSDAVTNQEMLMSPQQMIPIQLPSQEEESIYAQEFATSHQSVMQNT
ncbi:neuronal PAS domain-containing protein 2-like isoform X2 [Centruroides sculpturatus]|uniref:neuronal PAS domain-containing protein 2-like isoform X2 n=1 Tax=Centruroides sculpturatus TaxID=218467 RepID=UPI000C6E9B8B|nr:neuronal PAS domain-containing protein 2-like isoform X2 [Centruroides sculpturatus]